MKITSDITSPRANANNTAGRNNERTDNAKSFDARCTDAGDSRYKSSSVEKRTQEYGERGINSPDAGKLDYESRLKKNGPDVCRCRQRESNFIFSARMQPAKCKIPGDPVECTDSGKSEEEAATTIQAVYRGYKARRRFDEIRKSAEEKRSIRKVAELLSIPMNEGARKPLLNPIRISSSSANQVRNERDQTTETLSPRQRAEQVVPQNETSKHEAHVPCYATNEQEKQRMPQNVLHSRETLKSIRTIKSPVFFSNYDEKTSSPSDNTDTDDWSVTPRTDVKSTATDFDDNAPIENSFARNSGTNYQDGDNIHRVKPGPKVLQTRSWNNKRPLPQRISSSMLSANVDGYFFDNSLYYPDRESILVFGGVDPHEEYGRTGNVGKNIYRFKPDENIWELVGEIPQARHHHSVAYLRGRIYVAGGTDPTKDKLQRKSIAVESVWSYDPTTRTWFDEPGMLTARKDFGLVVSHGKMYAMGGQDRNGIALKTVESFDPSEGTWREMQPMQTARVGPATVKYRDLIWVAGGMTKSKKELFSKDVECYDPDKNLWFKAAPLRSPRCFATFYVVSDCLYVIGGASNTENGTHSIDNVDVWDADARGWKERANMSIPRHGHSIGSIGDQMLIIGGVTTVFMKTLNSVESYSCDLGKWVKGVSPLPHPVSGVGTVSLPPANLLINH